MDYLYFTTTNTTTLKTRRVMNENFKGDLNREKRAGPECL